MAGGHDIDPGQAAEFVARLQGLHVLVLGDLMLDRFVWGQVSRISPEAPVPVVHVTRETEYPGGAANVARNLSDLGVSVSLVGITGTGSAGDTLLNLLENARIVSDGIQRLEQGITTVKTRIISRQQQIVRFDHEQPFKLGRNEEAKLVADVDAISKTADAIIIEDYGKGLISQAMADEVIRIGSRRGIPVAVDPSPSNLLSYVGATAVTPNRHEVCVAAGVSVATDDSGLLGAGQRLLS